MMLLVLSTHPQEADAFEVSVELPQGSRCICAACVRIPGPDAPVAAALEASAIDLGGSHALRRSSDNSSRSPSGLGDPSSWHRMPRATRLRGASPTSSHGARLHTRGSDRWWRKPLAGSVTDLRLLPVAGSQHPCHHANESARLSRLSAPRLRSVRRWKG